MSVMPHEDTVDIYMNVVVCCIESVCAVYSIRGVLCPVILNVRLTRMRDL